VVVKDRVGRRRYILFRTDLPERDTRDVLRTLFVGEDVPMPKFIFQVGDTAVVRCKHWHRDRTAEILSRRFQTLKTTGTLKKAKKYLGGSAMS